MKEKKELQLALAKAKEETMTPHGENDILTLSIDQLAFEKAHWSLRIKNCRRDFTRRIS
jgi:hypothetical protein